MAITGWDSSKKITLTIDAADISADLTDFPVLVNLSTSSGKTGYDCSAIFTELGTNSLKIAVEDGDTASQCYVEIEHWDAVNNKAVLHVKVPSVLAASGAVLNLYYDSSQADNTTYVGDTGSTPAQNVWDSNFVAVYHMAQDPSGTAPQILDSTSNADHGTTYGSMTSADLVDGLVGSKAIMFDGTDDYVNIDSVLDSAGGLSTFTLDLVHSTTEPGSDHYSIAFSVHSSSDSNLFRIANDTVWRVHDLGGAGTDFTGTTTINGGAYHHTAVTGDASVAELFVDGSADGSGSHAITFPSTGKMSIAQEYDPGSSTGDFFGGVISEIRISNIARSAAWIAATNASLRDNLLTFAIVSVSAQVSAYIEQLYDIEAVYVTISVSQPYSITSVVSALLEQLYGLRMLSGLVQPYGNAAALFSRLVQYYGDSALISRILVQEYGDALQIIGSLDQPYTIAEALLTIIEQRYAISGSELRAISEQLYNISSVDQAMAILDQPWSLVGSGRHLRYDVSVTCGGVDIDVAQVNIEGGRDRYCLSCELVLASQEDYVRCRVMDELAVTIDGEVFLFFVESRRRNRGHATAEYTVSGLSRIALLDAPYADPVTADLSGQASQIVADLAAGYTVDWRTVDWYIHENTLMPADQTPLDVIRQVAAAAGAVVQTMPDGTLVVEPAYPVAVPGWQAADVPYHLGDGADFFTTGEDYDHRPGYNRYLVSDQLTSEESLRLVEEAISDSRKYVYAYQTPWRDDFELRHTGGDWVRMEPIGIEERLVDDELVEFVAGEGRTGYPIYERVSVEWLRENLGTVTFSEDGTLQASVDGESLLRISYRTRCRKYMVTDTRIEPLQIVAEEIV